MYDKRKLIILRAALIIVGAVIAGTAIWQYFVYYPDILRREYRIVVTVVSSAVGAAILGLSAKPFYRLGAGIASQFKGLIARVGAKGVAGVCAGLFTGGMLGYLFDVIIRRGIEIIAVRVLLDMLVAAVLAALCCYGFTVWLTRDGAQDEEIGSAGEKRGYLLTASCFFDDRAYTAAKVLMNVKVSDGALRALWKYGDDYAALNRLKVIIDGGKVTCVKCPDEALDTSEGYIEYEKKLAESHRWYTVGTDNKLGGAFDIPLAAFTQTPPNPTPTKSPNPTPTHWVENN